MQTFISETIQTIASQNDKFDNVVLILPSQRAKVFVRQALKNQISPGFLPEILNIEEFVSEISGIKKADAIELLFHLYTIYKNQETNPDSFDKFSTWAFTVIQDFNEIDQHLIDTKDVFTYIRDIERLKKWSVKGTFQETELIKNHHKFLEKLNEYYNAFYQFLTENKIGYQGVLYREATKNLTDYVAKNTAKKFYFIGFNALNASEEKIIQVMLSEGNTEVFWDIDTVFLENNHQAGNFIRKYKEHWKYYERNKIKTSDWFSKEKNIEIIGASKNITQIKYTAELLSKFDNHDHTALVLSDEGLLPIALNSLPPNVDKVNITMGYPLKDIPTTHLIFSIFQLFLTQEKLNKTKGNWFYYKNVISLLKQASIHKILSEFKSDLPTEISLDISKNNRMFINQDYISNFFGNNLPKELQTVLTILNPYTTIDEFLSRILQLITVLKEDTNSLEKEFLFRYFSAFTQLQNLQNQFKYFADLKTLSQFFRQLISAESLSFQGEPLEGLQLMGMLETRVLDFKNIILTSTNEGILPGNSQQDSFIPFDVKVEFNLPTYREKDAIFSYHFFRLLQRAENVYIIYNTENDAFGKGEKSRFVTQLELIKKGIPHKIVSPKVVSDPVDKRKIKKTPEIIELLKEWGSKNISPSALTSYLYNPVKFYQQKVLKVRQLDEVEETVAMNTMGTVVHEVLDKLYKPLEYKIINRFLTIEDITDMYPKVRDLVTAEFDKNFKNGDISTGKNRLTYEVSVRFIENFLNEEKKLLSNPNNRLKIIASEQEMKVDLEDFKYPIKIGGKVDRVDELNGVLRIIDYKTGMVEASKLRVKLSNDILDHKYHKAIQVMLYVYMYVSNYVKDKGVLPPQPIEAGIISFKNHKKGFLKLNFAEGNKQDNEVTKERIDEFMKYMNALLIEVFKEDMDFIEPLDLPY